MTYTDIISEVDSWMQLDGVTSIAESEREGKPCIVVTATKNLDALQDAIPKNYKGYMVFIEEDDEPTIL